MNELPPAVNLFVEVGHPDVEFRKTCSDRQLRAVMFDLRHTDEIFVAIERDPLDRRRTALIFGRCIGERGGHLRPPLAERA